MAKAKTLKQLNTQMNFFKRNIKNIEMMKKKIEAKKKIKKVSTKETLIETEIPREEGYLYYCGTNKKGNIIVGRSKMAQHPKWNEKKKVAKKKSSSKKAFKKRKK